jgi:hypothetical protein
MNPVLLWKIAKFALPAIAVIALLLAGRAWYNDRMDAAYNRGVLSERAKITKVIEKQNIENRRIEVSIKESIASFTDLLLTKQTKTQEKQLGIIKEIKEETVRENTVYTNCLADAAVLNKMNEIRALGPKAKETP